jgi:hypothetical protein
VSVSLGRLGLRQLRNAQKALLAAVEDLDDQQLGSRPAGGQQSIGWHLWHCARWDDHMNKRLGEQELWTTEGLQDRWGWPSDLELGDESAGTGLSDDAAAALELPGKAELVAYAMGVFERSQRHAAALPDDVLAQPWEEGGRATKLDAVLGFAGHDFEHGGMIAVLRGLLGLRGTPD